MCHTPLMYKQMLDGESNEGVYGEREEEEEEEEESELYKDRTNIIKWIECVNSQDIHDIDIVVRDNGSSHAQHDSTQIVKERQLPSREASQTSMDKQTKKSKKYSCRNFLFIIS